MSQKTTRRSFLKTSSEIAAVTAAVSTLGGVHTVAQEKDARLGIGIIGCGGIMTHHVQGLVGRKEPVEIAWLCDVDPAQIERMSKRSPTDSRRQLPSGRLITRTSSTTRTWTR